MPNITGHTELVGLMAYPIRHTQSPTTHNLAYDKNGDDVIQLAFEVDNDSLKDAKIFHAIGDGRFVIDGEVRDHYDIMKKWVPKKARNCK